MNPIVVYILSAVVAYLLGSIPFGYLLVRIFRKQDVRATGSGNIGATNVARAGGKGLGILTLALDAAKGAGAVWIGAWIGSMPAASLTDWADVMLLSAVFAVLGHMFPVWLRFRGGKGVATAAGAVGMLFPEALVVAFAVFAIAVALTRFVSLGSILAAAALPLCVAFIEKAPRAALLFIAPISLLVILKHHANIRRLLSGTENKLGGKSA